MEFFEIPEGKVSQVRKLDGYCTKNFMVEVEGQEGGRHKYVFKASRYMRRLPIHMEALNNANQRMYEAGLSVARPIPLRKPLGGFRTLAIVEDKFWKSKIILRAITFLEGETFQRYLERERKEHPGSWYETPDMLGTLKSMAVLLAQMDLHLSNYYQQLLHSQSHEDAEAVRVLNKKGCRWSTEDTASWGSGIMACFYPDDRTRYTFLYAKHLL